MPHGHSHSDQDTYFLDQLCLIGVCAAFALHYGWDLTVTRVITALLIIFTGVGALAYIAAWVIIPEEPYALPTKSV